MRSFRGRALVVIAAFAAVGCDAEAPKLSSDSATVRAGDSVFVRLSTPLAGPAWLVIAQPESPTRANVERVRLDPGSTSGVVRTREPGAFEVRLCDAARGRLRVIARLPLVVDHAALAVREPPAWYW